MNENVARDSAHLPSLRLDGKLALVTGAGRGLGRGCAEALADAGAEIVAVARTADDIESLAAEIGSRGGRARALVCDVTDSAQVKDRIGGLDRLNILVNNAGGHIPQPFLEVEEEALDYMLDLNIRAAIIVAQSAARIMARDGGGSIVQMSSAAGRVGLAGRAIYATTKHAIEGLTKSMALELAPKKIRVNAVGPTFIETEMTRPFLEDLDFRQGVLSRIPWGRIGTVQDVASAVVFLASPAADMITGASLVVDGGWTAQ